MQAERMLVGGRHRKFPLFQKFYRIPVPKSAFICINGLYECAAEHWGEPPDPVNEPVEPPLASEHPRPEDRTSRLRSKSVLQGV